jgi:phosphatidate phosphatase APP1
MKHAPPLPLCRWLALAALVGVAPEMRAAQPAPQSPIKSDEEVVLYPMSAWLGDDGRTWQIPLHGMIFEPEERSWRRALFVKLVKEAWPADLTADQSRRLAARLRLFLVDAERNKAISVSIGQRTFAAGTSAADGHFQATVAMPRDTLPPLSGASSAPPWLDVRAVTRPNDPRVFVGRIQLVPPEGLSVISDIDDTIKITQVRDRKAALANTLIHEFRAVPGMAEFYRGLAERGAVFHYVSGSPWQLYRPLSEFRASAGFPEGSFHLKSVGFSDSSLLDLVGSQEGYKTKAIEAILRTFPRRRFVLIGDSGEQDPEIYAALARRHAGQIAAIAIRNVTAEPADSPRWQTAFSEVPASRWLVFSEAQDAARRLQECLARP